LTIKGSLRSVLKKLYYQILKSLFRFLWLLPKFNRSVKSTTVHFLVVKDRVYASLLQIAVESLLFHNPRFRVRIHCDEHTYPSVKKKLSLVNIRRPRRVHYSINPDDSHWKTLKFHLLMNLSGTRDLFLDADTRINGNLPPFDSPIFLVAEKKRILNDFKELPLEIIESGLTSFLMKNTSAFSWGGLTLTSNEKDVAWKTYKFVSTSLNSTERSRLAEQISMSIFVEWLGVNVAFLKEEDSQFDKGIVESSYFGATSSRFF
jgi:hypothetical protein